MSQLKLNSEDKKIVKEFMRGLVGNKFNVSKLYMHEDLQFDDEDLKLQFSDKSYEEKITEYENVLEERVSPHGKRYFWIGGKVKELEQENDSDIIAIEEGYITITPVNIDMTNNKKIEILKNELL